MYSRSTLFCLQQSERSSHFTKNSFYNCEKISRFLPECSWVALRRTSWFWDTASQAFHSIDLRLGHARTPHFGTFVYIADRHSHLENVRCATARSLARCASCVSASTLFAAALANGQTTAAHSLFRSGGRSVAVPETFRCIWGPEVLLAVLQEPYTETKGG